MPRFQVDNHHPDSVLKTLSKLGLRGFRARKHGSSIIVESGPQADPLKHIRLNRDTVQLWTLDIADHRGRWEHTPFRASLDELIKMVADAFPWTLHPEPANPERTSDRKY